MSTRLTTSPMRVAPAGAAALAVNAPSPAVFGPWVEFVAASSGAVWAAGFVATPGTWAAAWLEVEIGTGPPGLELSASRAQWYGPSSASTAPSTQMLPVPVYLGPAGTRVAMRTRRVGSANTMNLALLYYVDLLTEHVSAVPLAGVPSGVAGVSVTPNGTAWAWSAWVAVSAGLAAEIAITGIAVSNPVTNVDQEWEIGTGAAAAEVGITRVRAPTRQSNSGSARVCGLAAPHPIAAGTRIAVRLRKSGTAVTVHQAQVLYLDGTALL